MANDTSIGFSIPEAATVLRHVVTTCPERAVMLWGPPGVGKSQLVHQVAAELGKQVVDLRLSQMDPPDLKGLPYRDENALTRYAVPQELPRSADTILFLDEVNAASRSTMAAGMQLVLDRCLGEYKAPKGMPIFAAGNRMGDMAVANKMPSALNNRFLHLQIRVDLNSWVSYALRMGMDVRMVQFLRFKPNLLHAMPDLPADGEGFPTPRAWEMVHQTKALEQHTDLRRALVMSAVGAGAMNELEVFLDTFSELPTPDQVVNSPTTAPIPTSISGKYAIAASIARHANFVTIEPITLYLRRFTDKEFLAMAVKDMLDRDPSLRHTRAIVQVMTDLGL